jgi:hypothetical protein
MRLKLTSRLKIAAVNALAHWLAVPVTVHKDDFPEVIKRNMEHYISESSYLLIHVYDQPPAQIWKFEEWAWDHLSGLKENPFMLHDSAFEFAGNWLGIFEIDDPRYQQAHERYRIVTETDLGYKRFMEDWRAECALNPD